jgi:hypothetical protein
VGVLKFFFFTLNVTPPPPPSYSLQMVLRAKTGFTIILKLILTYDLITQNNRFSFRTDKTFDFGKPCRKIILENKTLPYME